MAYAEHAKPIHKLPDLVSNVFSLNNIMLCYLISFIEINIRENVCHSFSSH